MITVTVLRPAGRDAHGDPLPGAGEHTVEVRAVAPGDHRRTESAVLGETTAVDLTLLAPFDADIEATDQVRIDDPWAGTYDVAGEPDRWRGLPGRDRGCTVALTRTGKDPTGG